MLIDEIERLERESTELADFRDRYYQTEKRVAVLEEKAKVSLSGEVIFGICLTIGAASLGYAPSVWEHQPSGWLSIAFGAILIVGGIVSKVVKR
jgi:hypothetical protein